MKELIQLRTDVTHSEHLNLETKWQLLSAIERLLNS